MSRYLLYKIRINSAREYFSKLLRVNDNFCITLCFSQTMDTVAKCILISNYGDVHGIPADGEYRRINETVFVKNDIDVAEETLMLIHKFNGHSGWSGCKGRIQGFDKNSCTRDRWGHIPDIAVPVDGQVNIWSKKGDSSGMLPRECINIGILSIRCFDYTNFYNLIETNRIILLSNHVS